VNDRTEIAIAAVAQAEQQQQQRQRLLADFKSSCMRSHSEHLQPDSEYNSKQALATVRGCILDLEFMARFD